MKVPKDLRSLFDKAEGLLSMIGLYHRPAYDLMKSFKGSPGNNPKIRIMKGNEFLGEIYPMDIWKSGKSLTVYVEDYIQRSYPLIEKWDLELWADIPVPGAPGSSNFGKIGGTVETTDYIDRLFKFFQSKEEATLFRDEHRILAEVGIEAQTKIEKQLRKRVAPQSSTPKD